jgi:hypothetical protein
MDLLKKIVGFILSLVATWLGYETINDLATSIVVLFGVVYAAMELIKVSGYLGTNALKVVSWLLGPLFAMALWLLQIGALEGLPWYIGLLIGITSSIAANFVYLSEWLEAALALIIPWFKKQQEFKRAKEVAIEKFFERSKKAA